MNSNMFRSTKPTHNKQATTKTESMCCQQGSRSSHRFSSTIRWMIDTSLLVQKTAELFTFHLSLLTLETQCLSQLMFILMRIIPYLNSTFLVCNLSPHISKMEDQKALLHEFKGERVELYEPKFPGKIRRIRRSKLRKEV